MPTDLRTVIERISAEYYQLTAAEKKVADYVTDHQRDTQIMSISDLAEACGVAEATITRFCRKLDYKGYNDFKLALAKSVASRRGIPFLSGEVTPEDDIQEMCHKLYGAEVDAISQTLSLIPPIYFHLPEYAIAGYWNAMSAAAPHTEFVIYNIPQLAGTALTMSLLRTMLQNPNVVAVKNSSMPTQDIQMFRDAGIAARGQNGFVVFNGPDEQFVSGLAMGADGGIGGTYAVMPELFLKMYELVHKGEMDAARALQYQADRIIYKMCEAHGNLYAVQKEILRRMYGLELGGVRAPLPGLAPADEAVVAEAERMIREAVAAL